jgi:hypothetical protein
MAHVEAAARLRGLCVLHVIASVSCPLTLFNRSFLYTGGHGDLRGDYAQDLRRRPPPAPTPPPPRTGIPIGGAILAPE